MAEKIKVLRVTAKVDGFRRAGRAFGAQAQDIPIDALSAAQLAAIQHDRMLVAVELEVDAPEVADESETPPPPAGAGHPSRGAKPRAGGRK